MTEKSRSFVPTDRSPMPPPDGIVARMLFTIQPGLAKPSVPLPMCFPNDSKFFPGQQADLYFFNLEAGDWAIWGTGTATDDGRQVCSDPGFGLPTFAWHFPQGNDTEEECDCQDGDPVDLYSGQFIIDQTDVSLPGLMPIALTRHYASRETQSGPFGIGTTHNYNWVLRGTADLSPAFAVLVGPNGRQAPFTSGPVTGGFINTTEPWLAGAKLTGFFNSLPFLLRFKDGRVWEFNNRGNLLAQRDRVGNQLTITREGDGFNNPGRVVEVRDEVSGRSLRFFYDALDQITEVIDPLDRSVRYAYDGSGHLVTVTDPMGGEIRYTYNAAGFLETMTDKRGNVRVTNEYDGNGRVIKQTMADGGIWQFAYQVDGGLITQVTVTDPRGNVRQRRFNSAGFAIDSMDGFGQVTRRMRALGTNLLLSVKDPLGRQTNVTYDSAGNRQSITYPDGSMTFFEYDPSLNQVTRITQALDQNTSFVNTFEYDPVGNLIARVDPTGVRTESTYNAFGQQTSAKGPIAADPPTTFSYDASGNLITITNPLGKGTRRDYDAAGRLIALTDARGLTTQFRYDDLDRLTETADARQGVTTSTYDPNGNPLTITDAKLQTTTLTYDEMDRLKTRTDSLGRTEIYEYDPNGNLTEFTDREGQASTFEYDAADRRTTSQYVDAIVGFLYDTTGRVSRITDSASGTLEFTYDTRGRVVQEIAQHGTLAYVYDTLGRRTAMAPNGQQPVNYQYDAASRLTQVARSTLNVNIGYDTAGRRSSLSYSNGTSTAYSYDAASRLANLVHQGPSAVIESLAYTYDAGGNIIDVNRANVSATSLPSQSQATYNTGNQQVQLNASTLTYDDNGNLTSDGTNTYTWDARNRLISMIGPGLSASFNYDARGRRVSKTINGITTNYLYDNKDIVQEIIGGAVASTYLRSMNVDEPFVRQTNDGEEYYHAGILGTTYALSDSAGTGTVTYGYEAFGNTTITGSSTNPFQYTGRENDNTGLYFYRNRYYVPMSGRFISEDPLGFGNPDGELNLYLYANGNPLKFSDPNGLWSIATPRSGGPPALDPSWGTPMFIFLTCLEFCSGEQLILTSTHEDTEDHGAGTPHRRGLAVDIRLFPAAQNKMLCCAAQCGAKWGHGGNHLHFQLVCGTGGCKRRGNLPNPPKCGCM